MVWSGRYIFNILSLLNETVQREDFSIITRVVPESRRLLMLQENYTVFCNRILLVNFSIISALSCKIWRKIFDYVVCALILPAIGLAHLRTLFELLRTSERLQL